MTSKGAQFTLIANVPYDTVRQDLVSEFRRFGRVELAMVVCDEASRHPHKEWTSTAGYAFVRFSKRSEAAAAIQAATMGLVTIRGVRVRADWARKDSYAKRGRVSPQQGAPLMGSMGVPDGIQALHSSLMSRGALPQETTPVWVASQHLSVAEVPASWSELTTPHVGSSPRKNSYPTLSTSTSSEGEEEPFGGGGLSDPTTSVGTDLSYSPVSLNNNAAATTTTTLRLPYLDSSSHYVYGDLISQVPRQRLAADSTAASAPRLTRAAPEDSVSTTPSDANRQLISALLAKKSSCSWLSPTDSLCAQLADLITNKVLEANTSSSTIGSMTPISSRTLSPSPAAAAAAALGELSTGCDDTTTSSTRPNFVAPPPISGLSSTVLSPCSRGLLAQALSDVAYTSCRDASGAASPTPDFVSSGLSNSRRSKNKPEELLHAAIECCDIAGIQL